MITFRDAVSHRIVRVRFWLALPSNEEAGTDRTVRQRQLETVCREV